MDRRQALKCAIGAAAGVALGGLPVASDVAVAGSSAAVLAKDGAASFVFEYRIPVSVIEVWTVPDETGKKHLCTSWRCVSATLENDNGDVATIKPYREGALDPSAPGLKSYARAINDASGKTRHVVVVNVPESHVALIQDDGKVYLHQLSDHDIAGGEIDGMLLLSPGICPSSQREGSAT